MKLLPLEHLNQQLIEDFITSVNFLEKRGYATVEQLAQRDHYQQGLRLPKLQKANTASKDSGIGLATCKRMMERAGTLFG